MALSDIRLDTCIVRNTAARHGRTRTVAPGTTAMRELHYGRIILDGGERLTVEPGEFETGLICLKGAATIAAGGRTFAVTPYDTLYVPRDVTFEVTAGAPGCDLAELAAKVAHAYPLQFVRFADVQKDPGLHFRAGSAASERDAEHPDRQERRGGTHSRRRDVQRARQLDVVAAARARRDARRGVSLHRHAGAGVRRAAGLHDMRASRSSRRSCAKATSC